MATFLTLKVTILCREEASEILEEFSPLKMANII